MQKEYLYGIIGLLAGILFTVVFASNAVNTNNQQMMGMMGIRSQNMMGFDNQGMMQMHKQMMGDGEMSMQGMVRSLEGLSGEEFDKAFIEQMIPHHQGAIDMAQLAKTYAKHDEIKNLANDIISAQTTEINMMREWQTGLGY